MQHGHHRFVAAPLINSENYPVEADNRRVTDWKLHMNLVPESGDYMLKVIVQHKQLSVSRTIRLSVR